MAAVAVRESWDRRLSETGAVVPLPEPWIRISKAHSLTDSRRATNKTASADAN